MTKREDSVGIGYLQLPHLPNIAWVGVEMVEILVENNITVSNDRLFEYLTCKTVSAERQWFSASALGPCVHSGSLTPTLSATPVTSPKKHACRPLFRMIGGFYVYVLMTDMIRLRATCPCRLGQHSFCVEATRRNIRKHFLLCSPTTPSHRQASESPVPL